jgi:hypothetical protein
MNGTSQHLTLEQLTSELTPAARAHLAGCAECTAQASDWAAVARGTRLIVDSFQPADLDFFVQPAARGRRRMLPYAAAAAVLALSAGGYGLAAALGGSGPQAAPGRAATTGLIATGCPRVMLTAGKLTAVNGDDLTVTPSAGSPVTVVTSPGTTFTRLAAGTVSDITDGDNALVAGTTAGSPQTGGTLTAASVSLLFPGPSAMTSWGGPGTDVETGTVTGVTGSGFTLRSANGARFSVIVSAGTAVVVEEHVSLSQLRVGEYTTAAGSTGSGGSLRADAISQQAVPQSIWDKLKPRAPKAPVGGPAISVTLPAPGSGGQPSGQLSGGDCQPGTLTMDYLVHDAS